MLSKLLLGGLAVMGLSTAILGWQLLSAREALGESRQALDQATLANEQNQVALGQVTMTLDQCIADRAVDEQQNLITIANLNAINAELVARGERVRIVREEIFRDPSCEELGSMDIDAMCPAWAGELRERAATLSTN